MTVLSVAQGVCKKIGLTVPDTLVTNTGRQYIELLEYMEQAAQRITEGHDWQLLSRQATVTGNGSTEAFDLESDYARMLVKSQLWSSSLETPLTPIPDLDEWLGLEVKDFDYVINAWTLYGNQIHIKPSLASAVTAKYFYQSNLIFAPQSGANKAEITADTDSFRLNEKLWKLGTIWAWKQGKGQPYAEEMADYEQLKSRLVTRDKGSRMIRVGRVRMPSDVKTAYPQNITP